MRRDDYAVALRVKWEETIRAQYTAAALDAELTRMIHDASAALLIPPGHRIDFLGDGRIKPITECATRPPEKE